MKKIATMILALATATSVFGQAYRLDADVQYPDRDLSKLTFLQGATPTLRVYLKERGAASSISSNHSAIFYYGAGADATAFVTRTNDSINTTDGYFQFDFTAANANTNGTFWYTVLVYTNSRSYYSGSGKLKIIETSVTGSPGSLDLSSPINWSLATYENTADSGPYRAGTGIHFGAANSDGSVPVAHSNLSSQASVDNSGGTVIQDVALTNGHVTSLTSYNLDNRYYTETEADNKFYAVAGDTLTGTFDGGSQIMTNLGRMYLSDGSTINFLGDGQIYGQDDLLIGINGAGRIQFDDQTPDQIRVRGGTLVAEGAATVGGDLTVTGTSYLTASNATHLGGTAAADYATDADVTSALAAYCPISRTVTVNGVAGSLETNLSFTVDLTCVYATNSGNFGTFHTNLMDMTWQGLSNALVNANAAGGGIIELSSGTIVPNAAGWTIPGPNIWIRGKGYSTHIDASAITQTDHVFELSTHAHTRISNLRFTGNAGASANSFIFGNNAATEYIRLHDLWIDDCDAHAIINGQSGADEWWVWNVRINNPDGRGVSLAGKRNIIYNVRVDNAGDIGMLVGEKSIVSHCISSGGASVGIQAGIESVINSCHASDNGTYGMFINGAGAQVNGGFGELNLSAGIYVTANACSINGWNAVQNGATVMILANGADDGVISGGALTCGVTDYGIHLDNCDDWTISGVRITGADVSPIIIDSDCDRNILQGNNLAGEPAIINNQPTAPDSYQVGRNIYSDNSGDAHNATADGMNDDRHNGDLLIGLNAGENITQWDVVYVDSSDGEYHQADADAAGEYPVRGFAVSAGTDGNPLTIIDKGVIRNDDWDWYASSVGKELYLSDTPGGITTNAQTDASDCGQVVGWVLSDDEIRVNVSPDYFIQESP